MKNFKLWSVACFMLMSLNLYAQTQMNYWALPPTKLDFTSGTPIGSQLPGYNTAKFYGLTGLVFDNAGNLIVAGYQDNSIRKVSPSGFVTTIAGNGNAGFTNGTGSGVTFNLPASVVLDAAQNIYVADMANHCIRKITPVGVVTTLAGNGTIGSADGTGSAARFYNPYSITIDASGNLYVADSENNAIRKVTQSGVVTTVAGICGAAAGFQDGPAATAKFSSPKNLAIDASGTIYLTDCNNNRVRKITSAGVVSTIAGSGVQGSVNGTGTAAQFSKPYGIALDASSNLYVTELITGTIRKITSAGVVTTYAGTGTPGFADGPAATAQFQWPTGLTLDAAGNLYEADNETHRIRKITPAGIVSTVAGSGTPGFANSPTPANYTVSNAAFDQNGNLLFSVIDNILYDKNGAATSINLGTSVGNEIAIAPVPGTCRDFFVICSGSRVVFNYINVSSTGVITSYGTYTDNSYSSTGSISIALSQLQGGNTRYLYALGYPRMRRYTLQNSGGYGTVTATTDMITYSLANFSGGTNDMFATELELSPDQSTLAWIPARNATGASNTTFLYTLSTASPYTFNRKTIDIGISPVSTYYTGLEYLNNSTMYFSGNGYYIAGGPGGGGPATSFGFIYKYDIATNTATSISNTGNYGHSQLELGRDGKIYGINYTNQLLGQLDPSTNIITQLNSPLNYGSLGIPVSLYHLPDQIDGENYNYFFGMPQLPSSFTINSTAANSTTAINTFTCSTITLGNTASSASAYQITINSADANGNIISGYSYTTGLISSAPAAAINIKALNSNYLATNPGYYKIQFYTQNACGSGTAFGLIQNSTISPASANFILNGGNNDPTSPNSLLPGTLVSAYGATISGSNSTGYIATFQIKVDQVDCTSGAVLTANIVNTPATAVTNGNPANISSISFNSKSTPIAYFMSHAGCFKITYTVTNSCGTSSQSGYFTSDPANPFRTASNTTSVYKTASIYPNPTNGITNLVFTIDEAKIVKCKLNNLQGGTSYTVIESQSVSAGINEVSFDTSILSAGLYMYELTDGTNTILTGKLVITK